MEWLSAPDILETENPPRQKIESNNQSKEKQPMFPTPTALFSHEGRPYQMTSSFGGRINFFTTENHIEPETIYSGYIDGVSYETEQPPLQCAIFNSKGYEYIDTNHKEFGIVIAALESYRDAEVDSGLHKDWDQAIQNSKDNIATVLESLAVPA